MDKLVIGYFDKGYSKKFFEFHKSVPNDFINARMELRSAVFVDSKTYVETTTEDIYFEMLKNNKMTIIAINEETETAEIRFDTPLPFEVFNSYYNDKVPIYN